MLNDDAPRMWHLVAWPMFWLCISLYIANQSPMGWVEQVLFIYFICMSIIFALAVLVRLYFFSGFRWPRDEAPKPKPTIPYNHVGTPMTIAYNQVTEAPKMDKMRMFCNILLHQLDMNKVDLRETYWVHPGRFESRNQFVPYRQSLFDVGGLGRRDPRRKNSDFIIADVRIIKMVAHGIKIEDMPPAPPS